MAKDNERASYTSQIKQPVKNDNENVETPKSEGKSQRKMSYKEFVIGKGLRKEFLAGFKVYLNGTEFLSSDEWEDALKKYQNRKI